MQFMNIQKDIAEILNALDRSRALAPLNCDEAMINDEIFAKVIELEYQEKPLSIHLGVSKDLFLPAVHLEDDEIAIIVDRMLDTMDAYNYVADLPEGLTIRVAYNALLNIWDEIVPCIPFGTYHFDFYDLDSGEKL